MMNNRKNLTLGSIKLINKIRGKNLLNYVTTYSREYPCWTYKNAFLSITKNNNTNIITNHDDIIKYLENEDIINKKEKINPLESPASLYYSNIF